MLSFESSPPEGKLFFLGALAGAATGAATGLGLIPGAVIGGLSPFVFHPIDTDNEAEEGDKKPKDKSRVEKNIDILKLLENSANNNEKEKPNILEQLDDHLKQVSRLNKKLMKS